MGRLIDADKLIILAENTFARPNGFIQLIEETETAYDVEKVVAELEELYVTDIDTLQEMAIDIVRKGVVE